MGFILWGVVYVYKWCFIGLGGVLGVIGFLFFFFFFFPSYFTIFMLLDGNWS